MIRPTLLACTLAAFFLLMQSPLAWSFFGPEPRCACLELVVAEAEVVLLCRVKDLQVPAADSVESEPTVITLQISESLKGAMAGEVSLSVPPYCGYLVINSKRLQQFPVKDIILFLGRKAPYGRISVKSYGDLFVTDLILFLEDGRCLPANDSQSACWSMRLVRLDTRTELLQAVREAIACSAAGPPPKIVILQTPSWLHVKSSADLPHERDMEVPSDIRLKRLATDWVRADDIGLRSFGLQALVALEPSAESVAAVKGLLADPYFKIEQTTMGSRDWYNPLRWLHGPHIVSTLRWYPLRENAQKALQAWGVEVPPTTIREPAESVPLQNTPWIAAFGVGGALAFGVFLLRRRIRANR